jgi:nitroreductase
MMSVMSAFRKKAYSVFFYRMALGELLTILHSAILHLRFSFNNGRPGLEKEKLEYYLVKHCHILEKGLALPKPRKAFGQPKIKILIKRTRLYEAHYSETHIGCMVRDTLREYLEFHANDLQALPKDFLSHIRIFIDEREPQASGGLKHLKKSEMVTLGPDRFREFLQCRHSLRNFSSVPVEDAVINEAISMARHTPSVCNRQGWRVHYYSDKAIICELLSYQNGNAGFTESIDKLLIVTGSTKAFTRYEHNQLFIDGGLYSMNLMLSLHAVGLGSCPLNTCMPWFREKQIKKVAGIACYERLIMMIAVGNLKDEFNVAQSEKYSLDRILKRH